MAATKLSIAVSDTFKEFLQVYADANAKTVPQVIREALAAHMDYILLPTDVPEITTRTPRVKLSPEEALAARRAKLSTREAELARARAEVEAKYQSTGFPWQQDQQAS